MNFKFTTLKSILSLVIGLLLGSFFSYNMWIGGPSAWVFSRFTIIAFFVGLILTYIIWSLAQKK